MTVECLGLDLYIDFRSASKILAKQPELISKSGSDGHTALHVAAINENIDVAKLLIRVCYILVIGQNQQYREYSQ